MVEKRKRYKCSSTCNRLVAMLVCSAFTFTPYFAFSSKANDVTNDVKQLSEGIAGIVVNQHGEPIIGATIKDVSTGKVCAVTDVNGNFAISAIKGNATLQVSYTGYVTQKISVHKNQHHYNIVMTEDQQSLNEIVVVGYGVQRKANLTGSVASISSDKLANRAVASVSAALAGTMSGVTSIQRTGEPGYQTGTITIRGKNSINAAAPLVVVDGVPGAMNNIDTQDIESISVLKDAASAAIYGVQAANGVILITTKKGKRGERTHVDYSGMVSFSSPTTHLKFLGSADYAILYNEAVINEHPATKPPYTKEDIQKFRDGSDPYGHPNTDWYHEVYKGYAPETQHNIAISGGSSTTTYMGSIGYIYQDGLVKGINYERYNGRINLDSKINNWCSIGMNVSAYKDTFIGGFESTNDLLHYTHRLPPIYPVYNKDGSYNFSGYENPVAQSGYAIGKKTNQSSQFFGTTYLELRPFKGFSLKGVYNLRHDNTDFRNFKNHYEYGQGTNKYNSGEREGNHRYYNFDWYTTQILANYINTFAKYHHISALIGYEQVEHKYRYTKAHRSGGGTNDLQESLNTLDTSGQSNLDGGYDTGRMSYFGRLQYAYQDKYLFEANLRADASSVFPKNNRWGYFPAVSAAWRMSEENFIKNSAPWISNLKLRMGWGKTGNEELGRDEVYPSIGTYSYGQAVLGNKLVTTAFESRYVNKKLKWATVTNYELGLDAGFLNNKVGFELSLYKKKTNDMLLKLPILDVLGVEAPAQNAGCVQNTGFDLTIFHQNKIGQDFHYAVNLNLSYVKNEIVNMSGTEGPTPEDNRLWYLEGYPIGSFYGYVANGFFNSEEEIKAGPLRTGQEKPGDIRYKDITNDHKITAADRQVIGKNFPSWTTGLNIALGYKNIDLTMLWQGAFDVDAYYTGEAAYAFYNSAKVLKRHLDRWTPTHHNATYPRITKDSQTNFTTSTFWLEDVSYVRLKNIMLSYTLPQQWLSSIGIDKVKIYFSGENLLTFGGVEGIDPESPEDTRGAFYMNVKKISLGLKLSF